jgi:hypothetical protein
VVRIGLRVLTGVWLGRVEGGWSGRGMVGGWEEGFIFYSGFFCSLSSVCLFVWL